MPIAANASTAILDSIDVEHVFAIVTSTIW